MIKSYWLRILLCGIGAAILGFLIAVVTPKQYDAVLQIMVAPYAPPFSRASNEADESVEDLLNTSAPRTVNTQVEVLTSYGVLQTAAAKVQQRYGERGDDLDPFLLQDKISILAQKESDIVTLRVRMSDPNIARDVAQEIYLAFDEENERQAKGGANRALDFLNTQMGAIKQQLAALDTEAMKVKAELGAPDVQVQTAQLIAQLKELESQLIMAQADQATATARATALEAQMRSLPPTTRASESIVRDQRREGIEGAINSAIADREQLLEHYLPDSEQVKAIDRRLASLKKQMASYKEQSSAGSSYIPNPILQQLRGDLLQNRAAISASAQRVASISGSVDEKRAELAKVPGIQQKLQELLRRQSVLERINALYTSKLSTLQLAKTGRRTNTSLITPATAIPKPQVPNYNLNVGLGLFLGLAVGFLWSVGTEAKRNPIRSLGQLNRLSLQPCYRVVPELRVPMRGLNRAPAEIFEAMLVNFVRSEKKGYRIGVLGVTKGAGATTTAMNLAIAAARSGRSVLYVEVDPGNNALTKLTPAAGDVKSAGTNITIFNASLGETIGNGAIGLPSELEAAAQGKDLVIFDFAPVKVSGDSFLLANQIDEMILLVRANQTKSVDFLQAQQALIDAGCPLVSVTLSRVVDQADDVAALEQQAEVRAISPQV